MNQQLEIEIGRGEYGALAQPEVPRENICSTISTKINFALNVIGQTILGGVTGAVPAAATSLTLLAAMYPLSYLIACTSGLSDEGICSTSLNAGLATAAKWTSVIVGSAGFFAGAAYTAKKAYQQTMQPDHYFEMAAVSCTAPCEMLSRY